MSSISTMKQAKEKPYKSGGSSTSILTAGYDQLHPRNPYYRNMPDFFALRRKYKPLLDAAIDVHDFFTQKYHVNWNDSSAVRTITVALLDHDFGLKLNFPKDYLCPPLPNRLNYNCWIADLVESSLPTVAGIILTPHIIDIGTGVAAIYAVLGSKLYGWNFSCTDIGEASLQWARQNLQQNPTIADKIELVHVPDSSSLQHWIAQQLQSTTDTSKLLADYLQEAGSNIATTRGPIRTAFAHMTDSCRYRLSDAEHNALATLTLAHQHDDNAQNVTKKSRMIEGVQEQHEEEVINVLPSKYQPLVTAVMTNPPFYDINEMIVEQEGAVGPAGSDGEMRTVGGELAFITAMILDSLILHESVVWYTAMVGKKATLPQLKKILLQNGVPASHIFDTVFAQGVTFRWAIAWTFSHETATLYRSFMMLHRSSEKGTGLLKDHNNNSNSGQSIEHFSSENEISDSRQQQHITLQVTLQQFQDSNLPEEASLPPLDQLQHRLAACLEPVGKLLSQQNFSEFVDEISFLSAIGQTQQVQWQVISQNELKQEGEVVIGRCQLSYQPGASATMTATSLLLLSFTVYIDNETVVLRIGVVSAGCSQGLANRLLQRTKEMIEADFIRTNRRWRRLLNRK